MRQLSTPGGSGLRRHWRSCCVWCIASVGTTSSQFSAPASRRLCFPYMSPFWPHLPPECGALGERAARDSVRLVLLDGFQVQFDFRPVPVCPLLYLGLRPFRGHRRLYECRACAPCEDCGPRQRPSQQACLRHLRPSLASHRPYVSLGPNRRIALRTMDHPVVLRHFPITLRTGFFLTPLRSRSFAGPMIY